MSNLLMMIWPFCFMLGVYLRKKKLVRVPKIMDILLCILLLVYFLLMIVFYL